MKGLLIKDLRIASQQKFLLLLMAGCGIICLFTMKDTAFIIGYATLLCGMLGTTTCAYDDLNHGMSFLLTLPYSRKAYVFEKYLFSIAAGIAGWSISTVIAAISQIVFLKKPIGAEFLNGALTFIIPLFLIPTVMIPILLKFGQARSRIVMFTIMGIVFAIGGVLALAPSFGVAVYDENLTVEVVTFGIRNTLSYGLIVAGGIAASFVLFITSFLISLAVIQRKEY